MNKVSFLNILLIGLCIGGFVYFLNGANSVASSAYRISDLRNQITRLNEEQSLLTIEKSATENPVVAEQYAQDQHMIEAKDILYVFENGNVALQR